MLGSPRSGVGLLAQGLSLVGGASFSVPSQGAGGPLSELGTVDAVDTKLLALAGRQWSDWSTIDPADLATQDAQVLASETKALVRGALATGGVTVFADWRASRFGEFWRGVLGEGGAPKSVVVTRAYESVVAGLQHKSELGGMHAALLWLRYTLDAEFSTRTLARSHVDHDGFLQHPRSTVERISTQLGLEFPDMSEKAFGKLSALISPATAQFAGAQAIALPGGLVRDWLQTVQSITRSWSSHGERARDLFTLDEIHTQLDRAGATFAHVLEERVGLTQKLGSVRRKLAKEEAGRASERKKLEQAIADLQQKLAAGESKEKAAEREKQLAEKAKAIKTLQEAAASSDANIAGLTATLAERQTEISSFRNDLQKRETSLAEMQAARDDLKAKLSKSLSEREAAVSLRADLEKQIGTAQAQVAALQEQLTEASGNTARQNMEIAGLRAAADLHDRALAERDGLMKGAMDAREGADIRLAQLTEKFTEQLSAYQALVLEKSAVEVELVRSAAALDKAGHDLAWVEGEKQGLRRDVADRDVQLGRLQAELEAAKEQKATGDQRVAALTSDLAQRGEELGAAKDAGAALQKASDEQAAALARLQEGLDKARAELDVGERQAAESKDAIAALEASLAERDARIADADGRASTLGADIVQLQGEHEALLRQRNVDAEERKSLEATLVEVQTAASEREALLAKLQNAHEALQRDNENKAEKLSMQTAQIVASRAKQAQLQQERLAIGDQLKQAHEELEQVRSDLAVRDSEAESLNNDLDTAREQMAKDQEALQKARVDVQGLGQHLQHARADAQNARADMQMVKAELEQVVKLRLDEVTALKRDVEARDQAVTDRDIRLADVESKLAQTQSALLQRQLETEESAEELRFLRSLLKDEQDIRSAKEEQLRLTDEKLEKAQAELLTEKDHAAKAELDHEKATQARFQEIALLMGALKDAQEKETDLAHLRVVRHELSRRTDSLYLLFIRVMDALLAQVASPLLPKKVNLRRQQAVLERYGLFDAGWYLENNPDVHEAGMDAAAHFVAFGLQEGRAPNRAVDELRRSAAAMADGKGR